MHSDDALGNDGRCDWRQLELDVTDPAGVVGHFSNIVRQREREFLIALLEDAIRAYQKYAFSGTRRSRRLFREVETWLTKPDADAPISFEYICDVLGVSPDRVRRALRRWRSEAGGDEAVSLRLSRADGDVVGELTAVSSRMAADPRR